DLRCGGRWRGSQFRSARQAPAVARHRQGPPGMGRRDAGRRPRGPHHDQAEVQIPAVDRWRGDGIGGPRPRLHPEHRPAPARRRASNFLVAAPSRSASHNSLAVMGPQLGYYYPEIVQQIDLHGPGIDAQGAAVPGLAMYILIGRTPDYAWSLTSAGHDVRDVYAEELCEP